LLILAGDKEAKINEFLSLNPEEQRKKLERLEGSLP